MNAFPDSLYTDLPLRKKERLENPMDWVYLWQALAAKGSAVLLESAGKTTDAGRWVILAGHPENEFYEDQGRAWWAGKDGPQPSSLDIFSFLDEIGFSRRETAQVLSLPNTGSNFSPFPLCLSGAWFGIFSYEFGRSLNLKKYGAARPEIKRAPDFYFFKPRSLMAFDRLTKETFYFGETMVADTDPDLSSRQAFNVRDLKARLELKKYKSMVEKVKNYIERGDIYQANIAQSFKARWEGNPASLYRVLREMNPGPFMGVFQGRGFTVVSSSPERLAAGQGDWLETRPIAGTRPRGVDEVSDLQLRWELKTNAKEQAEHLMLVDLARNDMGKVSKFGTVEVKNFASVESYAKVHHLVSVVQARRGAGAGISEILKALFPGGTITGCPKIRCMEIIEETEGRPRGYYTGSMGYVAPGPCFDLNILIRSFTLFPDGWLEFCAGAGIVADSNPEKEYLETLYKVEALAQSLGSSFFTVP